MVMDGGIFLALLTGGVALCLGHLGVGLAVGWRMRQKKSASPEPLVDSVERMRADLVDLSRLARDIPSLDREFAALLGRLTLSLDELHRTLTDPNRTVGGEPQDPEQHGHQLGTHAVGNVRILAWFNQPIGCSLTEENRPFAVKQPLAPRVSDEFPEPQDFELVQCHDLSPTQIRYLLDHQPTEEEVVIGLGLPTPIKYLLARIEDFKSLHIYGRDGFLVTATFVEALHAYEHYAASCKQPEMTS
jgi:hypothetical protein